MNPEQATAAARFREFLARPEERLDLATGALLIALNEYPQLDLELYLGRLDALGRIARQRLVAARDPYQAIQALNRLLFQDEGFSPNTADYEDPRNSFLNEVMDRKLGIPISLSVVYLEVAARNRLPLRGVNFPGHFILRYDAPDEPIFVDPFHGGRILTRSDLRRLFAAHAGNDTEPDESHLCTVHPREILFRMLHNLKRIYSRAGDYAKLLWVTDLLMLRDPPVPDDLRDHGFAAMHAGHYPEALEDLLRYASLNPHAADAVAIDDKIHELRRLSIRMN